MAQTSESAIAEPAPAASSSSEPQVVRPDLPDWQLAFDYQFNQFRLPANGPRTAFVPAFTANENGYGLSLTRFLSKTTGIELQEGFGFGSTSASIIPSAKSIFIGGGPKIAFRGRGRFEPWGHVLVGMQYFRFTQTASQYGSNIALAFVGGVGEDIHLQSRFAFRLEGNFLGTTLFGTIQPNWEAGAGIVFGF